MADIQNEKCSLYEICEKIGELFDAYIEEVWALQDAVMEAIWPHNN